MQRIFVIDSESSGGLHKGLIDDSQKRGIQAIDYRDFSPFPKALNNTTRSFFNQDLSRTEQVGLASRKNTTKGV